MPDRIRDELRMGHVGLLALGAKAGNATRT